MSIGTGEDIIWSIGVRRRTCAESSPRAAMWSPSRAGHWSEPVLVDPNGQLKNISCATANEPASPTTRTASWSPPSDAPAATEEFVAACGERR